MVKICAPCAPALLSCEGEMGRLLDPPATLGRSRGGGLEWGTGEVVLTPGSPAHEFPLLSISWLRQLRAHPETNFRKFENSGVG